jgi:hypothetical protein
MSAIKPPPPMKFFLAAFGPDPGAMDEAVERLLCGESGPRLGSVDILGPDLPFGETDYYLSEMGPNLLKRHMSFSAEGPPGDLVDLKLRTMAIEREMAGPSGRIVNLDPGYVFVGGLVLSTAKFSGHRLHLGRGVWGELTLHFHRGRFRALPWTYPDYQRPEVLELLDRMRRVHLAAAAPPGPGGPPQKGPGPKT